MSVVTPEAVKKVAHLARLHLEGETLQHISAQMDTILEYVQRLRELSTDSVEPTSHVLPLANVLRKDVVQPSLSQEQVTRMAPVAKSPFIAVPKIIES